MLNKLRNTRASDHLDLIRGLAAVAVLVDHLRYRFFLDYPDLVNPGWVQKAFYALTAFGHNAVMVFFVLSGYFISSSVIRDCHAGRWSWGRYLTSRLVRLYLVLLPALALTVFWDQLGLSLFGQKPAYSGAPLPGQPEFFPVENRLTPPIFLGNVCFLQSIWVPSFGSNHALWSLSYEFWYYLLFPCGWLAVFGKGVMWWKRAIYGALCCAGLVLVGKGIALYFPIWLLGTAIALLPRISALARWPARPGAAAAVLFCAALGITHLPMTKSALGSAFLIDYLTGLGFAALLYVLLHNRAPSGNGAYSEFSRALAGSSYTLYAVHLPLLVFLSAARLSDEPWAPDLVHAAFAAVVALLALGYALAVARLTEARTDGVREWIWDCLRARPRAALERPLAAAAVPPTTGRHKTNYVQQTAKH